MKTACFLTMCLPFIGLPSSATADVACTFSMSSLNLYADGWVFGRFERAGYSKLWTLCPLASSVTVNTGYGTVTLASDACKGFYSQLLTAKSTGKAITFNFHGPADCSAAALPADNAVLPSGLFPSYIGIVE